MRFFVLTAALLPALALSAPNPDPQVGLSDILGAAADANGYNNGGRGESNVDVASEIFGVNNAGIVDDSYTAPQKTTVNNDSPNCTHYEEDGFFCVPYYQCNGLGEIVVDGGEGLIDIRGAFDTDSDVQLQLDPKNSKCSGYLEVCCRHPDWAGEPVFTKPPAPKPQPYRAQCGRHNANGIGVRIQNDEYEASTQFGEWPHMCAVLEEKDGKNLYVCGASLIEDDIVMTAAHCVDKLRDATLKVRCGEWDTQQTVEPVEHQDRYVDHMMINPLFSGKNLSSNVALLLTEEPFVLSAHIDTICLPDIDDLQESYDWDACVATGWGKDKFGKSGEYQVILKQVELDVLSRRQCQKALRSPVTKLGRFFKLDKTFICAGGEGEVDTCKGDGGGPLVCPVKRKQYDNYYGGPVVKNADEREPIYVQAGIVSWGVGCGQEGIPGVYTDVATQLCYIDYASRCFRGDAYSGRRECDGWAENARADLEYAVDSYEDQLLDLPEDDDRYETLEARLEAHERQLEYLLDDIEYCGDVGGGGDVDLSTLTRSNAKEEKKKAREAAKKARQEERRRRKEEKAKAKAAGKDKQEVDEEQYKR